MRVMWIVWVVGAVLLSALDANPVEAQKPATVDASGVPIPAWFQAELRALVTGDSMRLVADNRQWKSGEDPNDAYGQRYWTLVGGKAVRGVMFGIEGGKEGRPFVYFLVSWHPDGRAMVQQWDAWGGYAEGELRAPVDGVSRLEQKAWGPDGALQLRAHDSSWESGRHVTVQIGWENGAWVKGRQYVWAKQPTP